jgi:hypothetical protein
MTCRTIGMDNNQQEYDVFVSYSWQKNVNQIRSAIQLLQDSFKTWVDTEQLNHGCLIADECYKGIINSKVFVCFLTESYLTSRICIRQLALAYGLNKPIIFIQSETMDSRKALVLYTNALIKAGAESLLANNIFPLDINQIHSLINQVNKFLNKIYGKRSMVLQISNGKSGVNRVLLQA